MFTALFDLQVQVTLQCCTCDLTWILEQRIGVSSSFKEGRKVHLGRRRFLIFEAQPAGHPRTEDVDQYHGVVVHIHRHGINHYHSSSFSHQMNGGG